MASYIKRSLLAISFGLLLLPLLLYSQWHFRRPPRTQQQLTLFEGMTYRRSARSTPRPVVLHIVAVDLSAPGIGILVTPGNPTPDNRETTAQTTSEFVRQFGVQLAVNASFFYPFREHSPWQFYPRSGERTNAVGQAISQQVVYSPAEASWPVLCFAANNQAQILESGECPVGTIHAAAGNQVILANGALTKLSAKERSQDKPYARVAVALDQKGQTLWLVVVDGKQPFYSEGVTMAELGEIVMELGADSALNLDGGGSTTLVVRDRANIRLLNAPIHTKIPMRERPVANHLGFFAQPATP